MFRTLLLPLDTPARVERIGRVLAPFLGGVASERAIAAKIEGPASLPPLTMKIVQLASEQGRSVAPVVLARSFFRAGDRASAKVVAASVRQMTGQTIDPKPVRNVATFIGSDLHATDPKTFLAFGTARSKLRTGLLGVVQHAAR